MERFKRKGVLLHFVQKLASNDNFDIVFRQVENLEAHIFKDQVYFRTCNRLAVGYSKQKAFTPFIQ